MRATSIPILAAVFFVQGLAVLPTSADDDAINTRLVLSGFEGTWELQPANHEGYKQRLYFGSNACGYWQQSENAVPTSITYYVEGHELLLQHYEQSKEPSNLRLKQLRFQYKRDRETLTLTGPEGVTTWKRLSIEPARIENNDMVLHEILVSDDESYFMIDAKTGDAQFGLVVVQKIARIADERGFHYFVSHKQKRGVWAYYSKVEFFMEKPDQKLVDDDSHIFDVEIIMGWLPSDEAKSSEDIE